ncbi:MAG: hypothetical protein ABSA30_13030, partial [Candidatus Aminicenantales bacterium]
TLAAESVATAVIPDIPVATPAEKPAESSAPPKSSAGDIEISVGSLDIHPGSDGSGVSGALLDLWKDAGVAPPMEAAEATAAEGAPAAEDQEPDTSGMDFAEKKFDDQGRPIRHSHAAMAIEREKKESKNWAPRIIGMLVAGLLGLFLTWALFTGINCMFGGGGKPHPKQSSPSKETRTKPAEPRSGTDWGDLNKSR